MCTPESVVWIIQTGIVSAVVLCVCLLIFIASVLAMRHERWVKALEMDARKGQR